MKLGLEAEGYVTFGLNAISLTLSGLNTISPVPSDLRKRRFRAILGPGPEMLKFSLQA